MSVRRKQMKKIFIKIFITKKFYVDIFAQLNFRASSPTEHIRVF